MPRQKKASPDPRKEKRFGCCRPGGCGAAWRREVVCGFPPTHQRRLRDATGRSAAPAREPTPRLWLRDATAGGERLRLTYRSSSPLRGIASGGGAAPGALSVNRRKGRRGRRPLRWGANRSQAASPGRTAHRGRCALQGRQKPAPGSNPGASREAASGATPIRAPGSKSGVGAFGDVV